MKRNLLLLAILLLGFSAYAQPAAFDRMYYDYKGEEGVVAIRIPGVLMKLAGRFADLEGPERDLLRSLNSIKVLTIEEPYLYSGVNFANEFTGRGLGNQYKVLLEVHDGSEDVLIAAREKNGKIRDLVVVVGGKENVLVHIRGRMDCDLLGNLASVAGIDKLKVTTQI